MKIIVDAMGGDHAPDEIVRGALAAKKNMVLRSSSLAMKSGFVL